MKSHFVEHDLFRDFWAIFAWIFVMSVCSYPIILEAFAAHSANEFNAQPKTKRNSWLVEKQCERFSPLKTLLEEITPLAINQILCTVGGGSDRGTMLVSGTQTIGRHFNKSKMVSVRKSWTEEETAANFVSEREKSAIPYALMVNDTWLKTLMDNNFLYGWLIMKKTTITGRLPNLLQNCRSWKILKLSKNLSRCMQNFRWSIQRFSKQMSKVFDGISKNFRKFDKTIKRLSMFCKILEHKKNRECVSLKDLSLVFSIV